MKHVAGMWKSLDEKAKAPFQLLAAEEKQRFEDEKSSAKENIAQGEDDSSKESSAES